MIDGAFTDDWFMRIIVFSALIGGAIIGVIWLVFHFMSGPSNEIRTEQPLVPRLEIVVEGNRQDTTYIYSINPEPLQQ